MCFPISLPLVHTHTHTRTFTPRLYVLVRVVDVELLQKQAVVEEAAVHLGQELEHDAFLGPQEDHRLVLVGTRLAVHHDARQAIAVTRNTQVKNKSTR